MPRKTKSTTNLFAIIFGFVEDKKKEFKRNNVSQGRNQRFFSFFLSLSHSLSLSLFNSLNYIFAHTLTTMIMMRDVTDDN